MPGARTTSEVSYQSELVPTIPAALVSYHKLGRAIAQAFLHNPLASEDWVQSDVSLYGIYFSKTDTVASFRLLLCFPLPILIPPNALFHATIIWGW
jgi:hypothetical protein